MNLFDLVIGGFGVLLIGCIIYLHIKLLWHHIMLFKLGRMLNTSKASYQQNKKDGKETLIGKKYRNKDDDMKGYV